MNDRLVVRACQRGAKSNPVESPRKVKVIKGNITLDTEELAIAMEFARRDRIEQDIRDYAYRQATLNGDAA